MGTLSRGEAGQLRLELAPASWPDFITALLQNADMMAKSHANTFQLIEKGDKPPAVVIDERRLRQVLDNLISNANRYTRKGKVTLSCDATLPSEEKCRLNFSVSDNGAGISPEELKKIFQPFTRGTAGNSSGIDGTGMGLAIVQQLIGLMGGEISVESTPGRGSNFSFSIDCALAEPYTAPVRRLPGRMPRLFSILVIDDDAQHRNLLDLYLRDCGFSTHTEPSGHAARKHLGKEVDLVITDQAMQDGDGWSVLQDWGDRGVPVILLSAAHPRHPANLADHYRFDLTLLKPFNADTLIAAIGDVLDAG